MVEPAAAVAPNLKGMDKLQAVPAALSIICVASRLSFSTVMHADSDVDDTAMVIHFLHINNSNFRYRWTIVHWATWLQSL